MASSKTDKEEAWNLTPNFADIPGAMQLFPKGNSISLIENSGLKNYYFFYK